MATSFYSNPFDLLGQTEAVRSSTDLPGAVEPRFAIDWSSFHQNFFSSIPVLFQRVPAEEGQPALKIFRQDSLLGGMERWTFLMAALLHVILFQLPWSPFSSVPRHNPAFDNTQLTWSGPVEDLSLIHI